MRKIEFAAPVLAVALALSAGLASLPAAADNRCGAQHRTMGQDDHMPMMGQDHMPMMGEGRMPMMGRGQEPMMGRGHGPMMGRGHGPMMGRAQIPMIRRGGPIPAIRDLSADDVRGHLERQLEWYGNSRLKVGTVAEKDDSTVTAEIVTTDDSLVQRLEIGRRTGSVRQVE